LYIIPSGEIPPNPAELIEQAKMEELIKTVKTEFDYVIIDTPPVAYVADTFLLAKYADVNLFVLRQNYSPKNVLDVLEEIYSSGKVKNMGIIFNDVNQSAIYGLKKGYGFNYGYSHGYGYGDGQGYFEDSHKKKNIFERLRIWFYSGLKKLFS
jgi:Mrp family chromosome partitioning ATPase